MEPFVISIRPHRLQEFMLRTGYDESSISVLNGVDGNTLNRQQLVEKNVVCEASPFHRLTRGEIGCFLSHKAVWMSIVENQIPVSLIFEDDCDFTIDKHMERVNSVLTTLEEKDANWKVCILNRDPKVRRNRRLIDEDIVVTGRSWDLNCYLVTFRGAQKLLEDSAVIREAVDTFVSTRSYPVYALRENLCGFVKYPSDTFNIK